ncbi:MAG: LuxR C-terminal-related transcriptional regulator [Chloroflexota bacterium]
MFATILQTKLYTPPPRPDWIERPQLHARLTVNPQTKLILVSAPAGYGKTTLIANWLRQLDDVQSCWLSLDEEDSDPQQFFRYLTAAIEPLPNTQSTLTQLLQSSQPLPAKTLAKAFINDVTQVETPFCLILDDYHVIDSADVDETLATLLELMPLQMTLLLTSRSDPGFPIARLRARGELIELRADDLRFTEAEAAQFLQETMGLTLQPAQIVLLESRTEGWITGLQMAALSMQNRATAELDQFVQNFTGSHRFLIDYLVEEALLRQREDVRTFLLATSMLDRLSGPLCAAVTQTPHAQEILEALERDNLFVVPLDDQRHWYRYHHLFADVLQAYAQTKQPEMATISHQRASHWFVEQNARHEAIAHAMAANDFELAADQTELAWHDMDRSFQEAKWLKWVQALPDALIRARPVLSAGYGWALLDTGQFEAAEPRLQDAERWLEIPSSDMVVVDKREYEALPATIAAGQAYLAMGRGDLAATKRYVQQTLDLVPDDDHFYRGIPTVTLGMAQWTGGELNDAVDSFAAAIVHFQRADNLLFAVSGMQALAQIKVRLGQLREAAATHTRALGLIADSGQPLFRSIASLHRGLGLLHCEQGDLEAARQHLSQSTEHSEQAGTLGREHLQEVAAASLAWAVGDLMAAEAHLDRAAAIYQPGRMAEYAPIDAIQCRIWLAQGELAQVQAWATQHQLPIDELSFLREYEHLTLARLNIALYRRDQDHQLLQDAFSLLDRLLQKARAEKRMGSEIECLLLLALVEDAQGNQQSALAHLEETLRLAQPQGYFQLFVQEGEPMADLLKAAVSQNIAPNYTISNYTAHLLAAFDEPADQLQSQALVEPLSERELEILALVAAGLKNKEVAEKLFISLNTVLYHTKNIYGKLGVNKRTLAIAKAMELNLIQ